MGAERGGEATAAAISVRAELDREMLPTTMMLDDVYCSDLDAPSRTNRLTRGSYYLLCLPRPSLLSPVGSHGEATGLQGDDGAVLDRQLSPLFSSGPDGWRMRLAKSVGRCSTVEDSTPVRLVRFFVSSFSRSRVSQQRSVCC